MSPFQGRYRLSTNLDFSKQIPYRLRHCYMGRCANIRRRSEAKHCSSLCSQSEGDEYCGGQARADNPTKSYPKAQIMFATCSWPSLCKQSELQCWRPILRRKQFVNSCNSLLRRPRPQPSPHPPPQKACNPSLQSPHREFPNRQALLPYIEHLLPRQMRFRKTFLKPFRLSEAILCFFENDFIFLKNTQAFQ